MERERKGIVKRHSTSSMRRPGSSLLGLSASGKTPASVNQVLKISGDINIDSKQQSNSASGTNHSTCRSNPNLHNKQLDVVQVNNHLELPHRSDSNPNTSRELAVAKRHNWLNRLKTDSGSKTLVSTSQLLEHESRKSSGQSLNFELPKLSIAGTNNVDQQRTNQQRSNSERLDLQDGPRSLKCHSDTSSSDLEPVPDVVLTATSSLESPPNLEMQCEPTTKAELEPENQDTSSNKNVSELPELYDSAGVELSDIALEIPLSQQIPYSVVSNFNNENVLTINDRDILGANESPDTDGQIERSLSPDWKKFSHPDLTQS